MQKRTVDMKREAALQARLEKLGVNDPVCGMCGETDPRTFELHHPAGQKQDREFTSQICANDHRKMSFEQSLLAPVPAGADSFLYGVGRFLIGIADMFGPMIAKIYEFGIALIERSLSAPIRDKA